jgi:hypothetical protein
MARRAFFSFHYENDVWRANIVRHSWVTKLDREAEGFIDAADFEEVKKGGDAAVKKWIDNQLIGTSVTIVLIGKDTSNREYVQYELQKSYSRDNGLLGIYIHKLKDRGGNTSSKGDNMFGEIGKDSSGNAVYFSSSYPCYDWINDDGYANLGNWIENAAKKAGK